MCPITHCMVSWILLLSLLVHPTQTQHEEMARKLNPDFRKGAKPITSLCPSPCQCSLVTAFEDLTVDCSNKGLLKIPDIPSQVTVLDLHNNRLTFITCQDFAKLSNLRRLRLSHNKIKTLEKCTFANLTKLEKLEITNNELSHVKEAFENLIHLTYLDLNSNTINTLAPFVFKNLASLQFFDISYNKLYRVLNNTFYGLSSLKTLNLSGNGLSYTVSTFELDAFNGLDQLENLQLIDNSEVNLNMTYPDQAISKLTNLRMISLDGLPIELSAGFRSLLNLEYIYFDGSKGYCDFGKAMPEKFFENLASHKLFTLCMHYCKLKKLLPGVLRGIKNLETIDMNKIPITLKGFESGSEYLNGSNITKITLRFINRDEIKLYTITRYMFRYLKNTTLKYLDLSKNGIYSVHGLAFTYLPATLEYISLRGNALSKPDVLMALFTLGHVKTIDASYQNHFSLTQSGSDDKRHTMEVEIQHGFDEFCGQSTVTHVRIISNEYSFRNFTQIQPSSKPITFPLPPSLEVIVASSMKIEYIWPELRFTNNKVLKYFDYSNNLARCWKGPLSGLPSLQHFDLSRNYCIKMNVLFFKYLTNLTTLLLYDNVLGVSLANDTSGISFSTLTRLETLNISGNTITTLSRNFFQHNVHLKWLNISRNALTRFDVDLYNIKNIEVLDLSKNLIAGFSENNCQDFAELKARNPNFKIRIQSNPLVCSCEYLSFIHLLITQPDIFDSVDSINCTTADGSILSHDQLATFYPQLMKSCVSQKIFIGTLVTFFVVLGIVLLSAMFYYNRWKFAYLYFIGSKKLHVGDVPLVYKQIAEVFITYEQEPEYIRLARQVFIPWLKDNHVTYLHGEDHFQAGPQNHNIAGAIVGTRKTLVLLSRDIFEDRYRELEMNLAIMHEMNCSDRILVPVFVGHFQVNTWPVEIVTYFRNQNHRCLLYEDTEEFWEMLMNQLKD